MTIAAFGVVEGWAQQPAPDLQARQPILLSPAERDMILREMQDFLQATQQITAALAEERMDVVAAAARRVGARAQQAVPASLANKLPPEFRQLGADTHQRFDRLAMDAEEVGASAIVLRQLGELLNNCNACHAVFRLESEAGATYRER